MTPRLKKTIILILLILSSIIVAIAVRYYHQYRHENEILKKVIARLEADSRVAEVVVTDVKVDENKKKTMTTIKFLEYDIDNQPMTPKYYRFSGNIIQFQSLVIRFQDLYIRNADELRGKSVYLFWKVFMLAGKNTEEFEINQLNGIPTGYKIKELTDPFEQELWQRFWEYALNPESANKAGVKNAQIEAPGTMFLSGYLYTIKIEHDGGLRIESERLPTILHGERIPN